MQFPLDAARFPPPLGGVGRAQTAAPSGLGEKVPRIPGSFRTCIARQPLPPSRAQMPFHAFHGKKNRRAPRPFPFFSCPGSKRAKKLSHPNRTFPAC